MCVCNSAFARRDATADRATTLVQMMVMVLAGADLHVGNARVAVLAVGTPLTAGRLLPVQFGLDAERFHFVHLADGLPEVLGELAPVVLVAGVERDQHLAVDLLRQPDTVRVVWNFEWGEKECC